MPDDFVIARNPDGDSKLPFLLRLPLGPDGVVLKARDTWARTGKIYCHRVDAGWPDDVEVVERVPVRSCVRRGAAIDLVLDRGRENRSQIVFTKIRGGRPAIFWQTARTAKQARPNVAVPSARAQGLSTLEIVVDSHERYPYSFKDQQVVTRRAGLPAGDYAVLRDGQVVAALARCTGQGRSPMRRTRSSRTSAQRRSPAVMPARPARVSRKAIEPAPPAPGVAGSW